MQTTVVTNALLDSQPQVLANNGSAAVSRPLDLTPIDQKQIAFEVTAASVSGTAGTVKLQHSFDGVNWTDVDATNAKVTISGAGRFALSLSCYNTTVAAKFPIWPKIRFLATAGASDAFTITKLLVTSSRP